jgi:hypothetical protein
MSSGCSTSWLKKADDLPDPIDCYPEVLKLCDPLPDVETREGQTLRERLGPLYQQYLACQNKHKQVVWCLDQYNEKLQKN